MAVNSLDHTVWSRWGSSENEFLDSVAEFSSTKSAEMGICRLCCCLKKSFTCQNCVNKGAYTRWAATSGYSQPQTFKEKRDLLLLKYVEHRRRKERCHELLANKMEINKLKVDIEACKEQIDLLKKMCNKTKARKETIQSLCGKFAEQNKEHIFFAQKCKEKMLYIVKKKAQRLLSCQRCQQELDIFRREIKTNVSDAVRTLLKYIFPIVEVKLEKYFRSAHHSHNAVSLSDTYSNGYYVSGQWVMPNAKTEQVSYRIVGGPSLPASGDYSQYTKSQMANKTNLSVSDMLLPCHTIAAGLAYTAQLVHILSLYLNVHLPSVVTYSDFLSHELPVDAFRCRVAKLNLGVLHLCFSQNVVPTHFRPSMTLYNLLLLGKEDDLGRTGPCDIDEGVQRSMELSLQNEVDTFPIYETSLQDCRGDDTEDDWVLPELSDCTSFYEPPTESAPWNSSNHVHWK